MYNGGFAPSKLDYITQMHFWRYVFASNFIQEKRVLDLACGVGYGSNYLKSNGAKEVVGVDLDPFAINYANEHFSGEGIAFSLGDCTQLPFCNRFFDIVVSFETIEHIEQYKLFISEIKRVLKKGGLFICSTPNTKYSHYNTHHIKEFQCEEFFQFVKMEFEIIKKYGQYFAIMDGVRDFFVLDIKKGVTRSIRTLLNSILIGKNFVRKYQQLQKIKYSQNNISIKVSELDTFYKVRPFEDSGESRLRIMLVVCIL